MQFQKPPEETDDGGSPVSFTLGVVDIITPGAETWMYVRGVTHRFSRERGFVTVLRGVQVPLGGKSEEFWFKQQAPKSSEPVEEARSSDSSPAGFLVGVLRTLFGKDRGTRRSRRCVPRTSGRRASPFRPKGAPGTGRARRRSLRGHPPRLRPRWRVVRRDVVCQPVRLGQVRAGVAAIPGDAGAAGASGRRSRRPHRRRCVVGER